MTRHGVGFWLAAVCVAAAASLSLDAPSPAGADEIRFVEPAIDRIPTSTLRTSAAQASSGVRAQDNISTAGPMQEPAGASIQPELPPDAANEPPAISAPDLPTASPPNPAA